MGHFPPVHCKHGPDSTGTTLEAVSMAAVLVNMLQWASCSSDGLMTVSLSFSLGPTTDHMDSLYLLRSWLSACHLNENGQ